MKTLKQGAGGIVIALLELVVGILLLIDPIKFTSDIIIVGGIVLALAGIFSIIKYFGTEAREAAVSQLLLKGLIALLAGAFCIFKSKWFLVTFPVITIIYGIVILVTGLSKIQVMVNMIRTKNKKWFLPAISAALAVILAWIILDSPFATMKVLWMFIGISLIVKAVFDMIAFFAERKGKTEQQA